MKKVKHQHHTYGHQAHKMMKHVVKSEPARSSGGHSAHAPIPLPHDSYELPGRRRGTRSSAAMGQKYGD